MQNVLKKSINQKIIIMKNLNLNAYGVSEMSSVETQNANGGWLWGVVIGIIISELLDRNAASDFVDGYNAAKPK